MVLWDLNSINNAGKNKVSNIIMLQADLFLNLYFKATQILDPWKAVSTY